MTVAQRILDFYKTLDTPKVPRGVGVMNPYTDPTVFALCEKFYTTFYPDTKPRSLILGINPGRFGSGATGIAFTDPVKLKEECHIEHTLSGKAELSADFIYEMIHVYGGTTKFYANYFISSVCPLGFTKQGKNLNYYDIPALTRAVEPYIFRQMERLIKSGIVSTDIVYCLGEGKNADYLQSRNETMKWFGQVIPLPHPRFIMQYKRKKKHEYIAHYVKTLA